MRHCIKRPTAPGPARNTVVALYSSYSMTLYSLSLAGTVDCTQWQCTHSLIGSYWARPQAGYAAPRHRHGGAVGGYLAAPCGLPFKKMDLKNAAI